MPSAPLGGDSSKRGQIAESSVPWMVRRSAQTEATSTPLNAISRSRPRTQSQKESTISKLGTGRKRPMRYRLALKFLTLVVLSVVSGAGANAQLRFANLITYGMYQMQDSVPSLAPPAQIAAGAGFKVARRSDGTVVHWGSNVSSGKPMPADLADVRDIAASGARVAAVRRPL